MTRARGFAPAQLARPQSLAALCAAYLADSARLNATPDTVRHRKQMLRLFVEWLAERDVHDAAQVTRAMIERYQRSLFAYRRDDGTAYSITYQRQRVTAVQGLFRWAVKRHRLPANPAADLDHPRPIKRLPDVLSIEDAEKILSIPDTDTPLGLRDRAMLEVLYSTGMRRMELCNLRLDDLDLRCEIIRINQGKGRKDRLVPIGKRALRWVGRYVEEVRPTLAHNPSDYTIFLSKNGNPLTRDLVSALVRDVIESSGVRRRGSCHLFRHTMATVLLQNGCDVRLIQEMLGHAKLDTTALYTHVGIDHLKRAHSAFHPAAD